MLKLQSQVKLDPINEDVFHEKNTKLYLLREDLIHPVVSGNKWRKLTYNIEYALEQGFSKLLTFGGAYSNHILAVACAAHEAGLDSIGVIRGEEHLPLNPTLEQAQSYGMQFHYVSRDEYRHKGEESFINNLKDQFGLFYLLPEGGSNVLAAQGCTEIAQSLPIDFDVICSAVGTGATIAGIALGHPDKRVVGFPALKSGGFLEKDIAMLTQDYHLSNPGSKLANNVQLVLDYHFGGYAKISNELVEFVQRFKNIHNIELDLIYTGKLMYGLYDLIEHTNQFDDKSIIAIHTGGVQGNRGFEQRLGITI